MIEDPVHSMFTRYHGLDDYCVPHGYLILHFKRGAVGYCGQMIRGLIVWTVRVMRKKQSLRQMKRIWEMEVEAALKVKLGSSRRLQSGI